MTTPNIHIPPVASTSVSRAHPIAPPTNFLSLAPATSASYPTAPLSSSPPRSVASTAIASPAETAKVADPIAVAGAGALAEAIAKQRRSSSSVSSESSGSVKQRFLKLGPAHWGENSDGKGDWADAE